MKSNFKMNKKGDIASIIYVIVILFVAGIVIMIFSLLGLEIYQGLSTSLDTAGYNNTEADQALDTVIEFQESSYWDYVFLAIAISYMISLIVLAYSTQIATVFYFIYGIVASVGLFVGVGLANAWEAIASNSAISPTIVRFPITNLILDNYYPLYITVLILSVMVLLFGKYVTPREGGIG